MIFNCAIYFFILVFIFISWNNLPAQFIWKASAESGFYSATGKGVQQDSDILNRIILQTGYKYKKQKSIVKINTKVTPEFYGTKNELFTIKFAADGYYEQQGNDFDWAINLASQNYRFSKKDLDISYETYLVNAKLLWFYKPDIMFEIKAGYTYRNLKTRILTNLDIFYMEGNTIHFFDSYLRAGAGMYIGKFSHSYKYTRFPQNKNNKNTGWRAGPQIQLNYLKKIIFTFEYQFLIHESNITMYPSYEQWFRLLTGKTFYSGWSVFILVEFYKSHFDYSEDKNFDFLYIPINMENRYFFKIAYDVNKNMEVYVKSGYFDKQLFSIDNSLSGWHGLFGVELHN